VRYQALVRGGKVVLENMGTVECDLAIQDGKIAAILGSGAEAWAEEVIDAHGLVVLPGAIDAHVHFGLGSPEDWPTESRAAARGGLTMVLNYIQGAGSYHESVRLDRAKAAKDSVIDYSFHFILMNDLHLSEIESYITEDGTPSFKFFTNFKGKEGAYLGIEGADAGFFYDLCRKVAEYPEAVLAVHTENIEIVWRLASRLKASGRDGLAAWTDSRPDFVEAHDMFTAFLFAERTGAQIYIPHLSCAAGLEVYREHLARGGRSYIETCSHYLTHTKDSELGGLAKVNPPVRTRSDQEALWRAIADGTVAVVGSDHNSRPRARKEGSIWTASAGFPGVATLLPVLLSEGYAKRGLPLERIAQVVSTNPAKIFGMYPKKGTIAVGSDADLTIADLGKQQIINSADFGSRADYSIYDGWEMRGWPVATTVRGTTVMRENQILVPGGFGQFVSRPVAGRSPQRHVEYAVSAERYA